MIYADNAATTKIDDQALTAMLPYLQGQYGNASGRYSLGHQSKRAIEHAREQVSSAIGTNAGEIIFTSGGSESDNWAIRGALAVGQAKGKHIITSAIEHLAILNTCAQLEKEGYEITYLPVDSTGKVNPQDVEKAIKATTVLVSIMMANNEVGTIQSIRDIGKIVHQAGVLFHTDAVQAVGHIPVDVNNLDVDLLSASAHKFYGPKGVGFLFIREGVHIRPFIFGGHQENGLRAGTENVAGIVGTGQAIELCAKTLAEHMRHMRHLSEMTIDALRSQIPEIVINGHEKERHPGIVSISLPGVEGESMMSVLDTRGICVSTSSACTSGQVTSSHVLIAMGILPKQASSTIRISYGKFNSEDEVGIIVREISGIYLKLCK